MPPSVVLGALQTDGIFCRLTGIPNRRCIACHCSLALHFQNGEIHNNGEINPTACVICVEVKDT